MLRTRDFFSKMRPADIFFCALGMGSFFAWLYAGGWFGHSGDDWCYFTLYDPEVFLIYLIFILPILPASFRFFRVNRLLFLMILMAIGIVTLFHIPNFNIPRGDRFMPKTTNYIQDFRKSISENYLPAESDITPEGIFCDYYFGANDDRTAAVPFAPGNGQAFRPLYFWAASKNVLSGENEIFLVIGLPSDAGLPKTKRKKLNIVVALDISAFMANSFPAYYYDQMSEKDSGAAQADPDRNLSMLALASRATCAIIDRLEPEDRFGMVLFDNSPYLAKPSGKISRTDLTSLKKHIMGLRPTGIFNYGKGPNLEFGRGLLNECSGSDTGEIENRLIVMTSVTSHSGCLDTDELFALTREFAGQSSYSTFIGIGSGFQPEIVERINAVRGANYYSICSAWEFKKRLIEEFGHMVKPTAFNLALSFRSERWAIEESFGASGADLAAGELMKINTVFPSPISANVLKGGVIVLKLRDLGGTDAIKLSTSYELPSGEIETDSVEFVPGSASKGTLNEKDARKAILLSRYVLLMREWIRAERAVEIAANIVLQSSNYRSRGMIHLRVSDKYRDLIEKFMTHFREEARIINDPDLKREDSVLDQLSQMF